MNPTVASDQVPAANSPPSQDDPRVARALEEYLAALEEGRAPDRREFLARHADIADALAEGLGGLEFIRSAAPHVRESALSGPAPAAPVEGLLGDYRILREIGRGG